MLLTWRTHAKLSLVAITSTSSRKITDALSLGEKNCVDARETLALTLMLSASQDAGFLQHVRSVEEDPTLQLTVVWATHKFRVGMEGSEEVRAGSGGRTDFFLCIVKPDFFQRVHEVVQKMQTETFVRTYKNTRDLIARDAVGQSICFGYHTTMWFQGAYTETDAEEAPSSRLLFKYAVRYSRELRDCIRQHWRALQCDNCTNLCYETLPLDEPDLPADDERRVLDLPTWDPTIALGEVVTASLGFAKFGWPRGVTPAELRNLKRQWRLAVHPDKRDPAEAQIYTEAFKIVNDFIERNASRMGG